VNTTDWTTRASDLSRLAGELGFEFLEVEAFAQIDKEEIDPILGDLPTQSSLVYNESPWG
jgi:hypothetical protein